METLIPIKQSMSSPGFLKGILQALTTESPAGGLDSTGAGSAIPKAFLASRKGFKFCLTAFPRQILNHLGSRFSRRVLLTCSTESCCKEGILLYSDPAKRVSLPKLDPMHV
jgi:hypothetical protein